VRIEQKMPAIKGAERNRTQSTPITVSKSPTVFEIIKQNGLHRYVFELTYLTIASSLPKIHEDCRFFFVASDEIKRLPTCICWFTRT
jgi:hypothetical protein